ncbi:MAG: TonB-dependent receptor domain-containing protein [Salibacteraceae bacterium]
MKPILTLLSLCLVLACSAQYTISGYLQDESNGEMLIGATVYDLKSGKGTTTNVYGFFSLTLPEDSVRLRISYVGFETQVMEFYLNADRSLNVNLSGSVSLNEFEVVASEAERMEEKSEMSTIEISMDKVKALPVFMGERDIMKTIQLLPGVQSGSEASSGLYVRGGGPDQNLILLDGVPIYNASHLFGFFSVFNADALNSVKLIKGGFPARYGGRLSSVIDIRMKEGNMKEFHGEGSIGLISSKLTLEGPIVKDKTSFIVSGRRTYIDLLAQPLIRSQSQDGSTGGYYFYDVNAKLNHKFSDKSRLFASGYFGNDRFYSRLRDRWDDGATEYESKEDGELKWGNVIGALRWNYLFSNKLFSNTTFTYSRYKFLVGFSEEETSTGQQNETESISFDYSSGIEDYNGKIDFDYLPHPDHYVRFGVGHTYHTFTPGINTFNSRNSGEAPIDTAFGSSQQYSHESWLYVEDDVKIGNRIKANFGLHGASFYTGNKFYFSLQPRFSGRYLLRDNMSIKASYARMTQFLHLLTNAGIGLPTDLWLPVTDRVPPQQSHQVALGVAYTHRKKYEISLEGYYKSMDNLIEYKDGASFFGSDSDWQNKVEVGRGWSYGAEFLLEKKVGKTSGWIGYTLSWTNRQFDNLNFGETFPYRYDRRHDIGIALTHKFNEKVDVGVVWVYGTGNAVSLGLERYNSLATFLGNDPSEWGGEVEHIQERNNYRMPSYHRLDLGVNLHKDTRWGQRTWSFGLYNVYSRQNPFYLYFAQNSNGSRELTQISLFPILPSFSYQFKF